jgi:hypothetical protein
VKTGKSHAATQLDPRWSPAVAAECFDLVAAIKGSDLCPATLPKDAPQLWSDRAPMLLKSLVRRLVRAAESSYYRVSSILVATSLPQYEARTADLVRARDVIEDHPIDSTVREWIAEWPFDERQLAAGPQDHGKRLVFRTPGGHEQGLAPRVKQLTESLGLSSPGVVVCVCALQTIVDYQYGHDVEMYAGYLAVFEQALRERETEAEKLVQEVINGSRVRCYQPGDLGRLLDRHPELEPKRHG